MANNSRAHRKSRRPATRAVHAGLPAPAQGEAFLPGPTFAGPFHLSGDPERSDYVYGRYGNPTWTRYEEALAELEGGEAVAFASGMAAITAVLLGTVSRGDVVVLPADGYFTTRRLGDDLAERGVEVRTVPTRTEDYVEAVPGAALVWVETPTNPTLEVCDLRALAEAARAAGAVLGVDNTLATPLLQRPLELGADLSMSSGTKALSGHGDLMIGHVAARDPERAQAVRSWRTKTGSIPGPFEAWLAHRSLATLGVRVERQCSNAQALARLLAGRGDVLGVRYPGLPDDPGHETARGQMDAFGPVVGFELAGREHAERFLGACELVAEATSFGAAHSTAERRARWASDDVSDGFVRLSAGCEATEDLLDDVAAALDAARG